MTGQTTARAAGGSELAVAWVRYGSSANNPKIPIVFEDGMTWAQWQGSEYYLYYMDTYSKYSFGLSFSATSNRITCMWMAAQNSLWDPDNLRYVDRNDPIRAGLIYNTTT